MSDDGHYWQIGSVPTVDQDAPSWVAPLAEITAILLEVRGVLTGNGVEHDLKDVLEIVRLTLLSRDNERHPRNSWPP
jgi:hypothetical protein